MAADDHAVLRIRETRLLCRSDVACQRTACDLRRPDTEGRPNTLSMADTNKLIRLEVPRKTLNAITLVGCSHRVDMLGVEHG